MGASFGSYGGGGGEGLNGEDMGPQGLVSGHAYTVLDARRFRKTKDASGQPLMLVQYDAAPPPRALIRTQPTCTCHMHMHKPPHLASPRRASRNASSAIMQC